MKYTVPLDVIFVIFIGPLPTDRHDTLSWVRGDYILGLVDRLIFLKTPTPHVSTLQGPGRACGVARSGVRTDLDLRHEAAIGRDAIPPVLDQVEGILPGQVVELHDVHHDKRGRQADSA